MPTRWAFEGVLLLESPHHPAPASSRCSGIRLRIAILPKTFSPPTSERMGTAADAMALASMLIGMAAAVCSHPPGRDKLCPCVFAGSNFFKIDILRLCAVDAVHRMRSLIPPEVWRTCWP